MNVSTLIHRILAQHTRSTNSDYRGDARLVPSISLLAEDLKNGILDGVREKHDHTVSRTVSDLQARNDRQYAKIQNLEEDILDLAGREGPLQSLNKTQTKTIKRLRSDKGHLQRVNNSLRATVDRLKGDISAATGQEPDEILNLKDDVSTFAKRNEGLEMLVVELQEDKDILQAASEAHRKTERVLSQRNEILEDRVAKAEGEVEALAEEREALIKEREASWDETVERAKVFANRLHELTKNLNAATEEIGSLQTLVGEGATCVKSLKIKMTKQSARIQNLERSLENERARGGRRPQGCSTTYVG